MHQNSPTGFCIKNIQTNSEGRDPRTPAVEGETFVRTHPVPTCQMLVPSVSYRLAMALRRPTKFGRHRSNHLGVRI